MEIKYDEYQVGFSGVDIGLLNSFLKKSYLSNDSFVLKTISMIETIICSITQRQFKVLPDTDFYYEQKELLNTNIFDIYNYPFKLKKIYFNGVLVYEEGGTNNTFIKDTDFIVKDYSIVFSQRGKYKVLYNIEKFYGDDITLAVLSGVSEVLKSQDFGLMDIGNISIGGTSYSIGKKFYLLNEIVKKYKKVW